jgi:aminoglycoside phosphotransferase (APT) family kinase protein
MIDMALARRPIASQFPQWSRLPITPVEFDGSDNRSFRLGSELTVRLPSGDWYVTDYARDR